MKTKISFLALVMFGVTFSALAQPVLLKDILPGNPLDSLVGFQDWDKSSGPTNLTVFDEHLYFSAPDTLNASGHVYEHKLWSSGGTSLSTNLVHDFNPGGVDYVGSAYLAEAQYNVFNVFDDQLFFGAYDGSTSPGVSQLFVHEGIGGFSGLHTNLSNIPVTVGAFQHSPHDFINLGDNMIFKALCGCSDDPTYRWMEYDKTTGQVGVLGEGYVSYVTGGNSYAYPVKPTMINQDVMVWHRPEYIFDVPAYQGVEGFFGYNFNTETLQILDSNLRLRSVLGAVNDSVFLVSLFDLVSWQTSLFSVNRNNLAIESIHAFNPVSPFLSNGAFAAPLGIIDHKLYFFVSHNADTTETGIWVSDGTSAGTYRISGNMVNDSYGMPPTLQLNDQTILFATLNWDDSIYTLWSFNGTQAVVLNTFSYYNENSAPLIDGTLHNGKAYFIAQSVAIPYGKELWVTDGAIAGTQVLVDAQTHSDGSSYDPSNLVVMDDKLFFSAYEPSVGREVFYLELFPTGVMEQKQPSINIKIFPNPAQDYVDIAFETTEEREIYVYNTLGALVMQTKTQQAQERISLLNGLKPGIYTLHIKDRSGVYTSKLIKL